MGRCGCFIYYKIGFFTIPESYWFCQYTLFSPYFYCCNIAVSLFVLNQNKDFSSSHLQDFINAADSGRVATRFICTSEVRYFPGCKTSLAQFHIQSAIFGHSLDDCV